VSGFSKVIIVINLLMLSFSAWAFDDVSPEFKERLTRLLSDKSPNIALKGAETILGDTSLTPQQRFETLMVKAKLYHKKANLEHAITTLLLAAQHASLYHLYEEEAQARKLLGVMNYYKGDNHKALINYQKSLVHYQKEKQYLKQAHLLNNIALVNAAMGEVDVALTNYKQAQALYVDYGTDIDSIDVNFNIAGLYNRLHRFDIAIQIFINVIEERTKRDDKFGVALAHGDLGISYFNTGQYNRARHHYFKALNYLKEENLTYHVASQLENVAELFLQMGMVDESIEYGNEAIKLAKESDNQYAFVSALHSLAKARFYLGEFDAAFDNIKQSDVVSKQMQYSNQLLDNLLLMSLIHAAKHETSQALTSFYDYKLASKEPENQKLADKLTQYQAQFESEQLKREVVELIQKEKLNELRIAKARQQQKFLMGGFVLVIFIIFFGYRSANERRLKFKLTKKVKQRTEELEVLMENLQQANTIKNQFLANMSHEIRTPLTAVIGQAESIIAGDVEPEFILKEIEIIYSNSHHLLTLINDILDLSRIEANKFELEIKQYDIHHIVDEVSDLFKEQAHKKSLTFSVVNELSRPFIMTVDQLRLKQILINLCSNAIKFTYHGQVILKVSNDEHKIHFSVHDTGIGLTEQQLEQIFNHFTQGDSSISRRFGGSGLGLCLSQQLALMMNGNIAVNSEYDVGSEFTLTLSMAQPLSDHEAIPAAITQLAHDGSSLSGLVLLADDHDDNRRLTERLLNVLGLDVVTASNGLEAIEQYNLHKPALILLDIQMPEMDGIEAFKILRSQDATIPIIALTANAMSHEIEQYLGLGFDDYISKPIVRNRFIQTLAYYLKQRSTPEQSQLLNEVDFDDLTLSFRASFDKESRVIGTQLANLDYKELAATAHRLSGAASMFNHDEIASLSAEIELAIMRQNFQKAQTLTRQLIEILSTDD